jgi:hypothetical protein
MDYMQMTAPCGLDCFNCAFYLAPENPDAQAQLERWSRQYNVPLEVMQCRGCRDENGKIPLQLYLFGESHYCAAYECAREKGHLFCGDCKDFPCDNLHPYADKAAELPHNVKVFNLCLIKKLGLENWAESKAGDVRETYFNRPWKLS